MNGFSDKSALPSTSPLLHFHAFAEGGVLFREGTRRVWALNAASAYIWCMIDQVPDIESLARAMAERFSIDPDTARRDVRNMVARLEQEGLLGAEPQCETSRDEDAWDIAPHGPLMHEPARWAVRRLFATPNHVFEVRSADFSIGEAFMGNMNHLVLTREAAADTRLAVLPAEKRAGSWDVCLDGRRYVGEVPGDMVLPNLSTLVFVRACEALHDKLLFHAAVLGRGGKAVLFPAEAGSGKSTLAAVLAARGYRYFSDELAVLDVKGLGVIPFPLPMSIKPGSTAVLERYYPGLSGYPVHHRTDGKRVRYLSPPAESLSEEETVPIHALVFPRYEAGVESRLAPLAKDEALRRLARTGSSNREFTSGDVRAMIGIVEQNPCCEMVISDIEEAVSLLEKHVF